MALDLFVNNERNSNNSLFYRTVSTGTYAVTVKLSDQNLPNENLGERYIVEYFTKDNTSPLSNKQFLSPNSNGYFILPTRLLPRTVEGIYSWFFSISTATDAMFVRTFEMSCAFLNANNFPTPYVNILAYPSLYVDISGTPATNTNGSFTSLTQQNFRTNSKGIYFYGEGHTETINLSNNLSNPSFEPKWMVGNPLTAIQDKDVVSYFVVNKPDLQTATVPITSLMGYYPSYPISLWVTNTKITTSGPFISYDDIHGQPYFYSFFNSTVSADLVTKVENNKFKSNIEIFPYPENDVSRIISPFPSSNFFLPFNYKSSTFVSYSSAKSLPTSLLTLNFAGTRWELSATSELGDWSSTTPFLSSITAYKFNLSYEEDTASLEMPAFKLSPIFLNTLNLTISSYKQLKLNNVSPNDWKPKTVCTVTSLTGAINPIPFNKIFTPNYFNLRGEDVSFTIISTPTLPFVMDKMTLRSSSSKEILVLENGNTTGTMKFDTVGVVDLSATAVLKNIKTNVVTDTSLVLQDIIEIVKDLDVPAEEDYFHDEDTPLMLTNTDLPRLSPNEWVTADNINSIIKKLYLLTDEIETYSKLYVRKDKFYGYLSPAQKRSVTVTNLTKLPPPPRLWMDLDCTDGNITDEQASWSVWEAQPGNNTVTWEYQTCEYKPIAKIDPSCYQKYCIQWTWRWRKRGASTIDIAWADTKSKTSEVPGNLPKKWAWEICNIDAEPLNCDRANWNITTTDYDKFPIPDSVPIVRCSIVDADVNAQTNQLVVAHPTEIHLIDRDYYCTHRARTGMADTLFTFQQIVAVATNANSKVVVLDRILPRVCVYSISQNDFVLIATWGGYGLKDNPQNFRQPLDLHLDKYNSVFVADSGNNCIKKFTIEGKPLMTITHEKLENGVLLSVCVDSQDNVHCLMAEKVIVFDAKGMYLFEYRLHQDIIEAKKINVSFNKEMIYIAYRYGVAKYFRNGIFAHFTMKDMVCGDGYIFEGYNSVSQDKFRNVFVTAGDKILQIPDLQHTVDLKAPIPPDLYWNLEDLLIHKEEYIQPWVYLKAFHRLWDNIELLRNSLFYSEINKCKFFVKPTFTKEDLIIGQNEIVTNAVINRLAEQLWTNLQSLVKYFDPDCEN